MSAPIFPIQHVTVGIGKEGLFGVAVTPSMSIPVKAPAAADVHTPIPDQGWRGPPAGSFGHVPGPLEGLVSLGGDVFADTIGFALAGLLGDSVASGSGPVTWTMAVLNGGGEPPSYTVTTSDPINARQWAGCKFSSLTLASNATGALTWSSKVSSLASAPASAPAVSYSTVELIAGWRLVVQLGGTTVSTVLSSSVTIERAIAAKRNTDGSQAPYLIHSGLCSVSGQLELIMQTDTYRALFVAGTPTSIDLNYAQGTGSTATQTRIHCSQIALLDVAPDYATGPFMRVKVAWTADYNTTDVGTSGGWSPVKATLKNAVASGTF